MNLSPNRHPQRLKSTADVKSLIEWITFHVIQHCKSGDSKPTKSESKIWKKDLRAIGKECHINLMIDQCVIGREFNKVTLC